MPFMAFQTEEGKVAWIGLKRVCSLDRPLLFRKLNKNKFAEYVQEAYLDGTSDSGTNVEIESKSMVIQRFFNQEESFITESELHSFVMKSVKDSNKVENRVDGEWQLYDNVNDDPIQVGNNKEFLAKYRNTSYLHFHVLEIIKVTGYNEPLCQQFPIVFENYMEMTRDSSFNKTYTLPVFNPKGEREPFQGLDTILSANANEFTSKFLACKESFIGEDSEAVNQL
jgi:hypothetical protein